MCSRKENNAGDFKRHDNPDGQRQTHLGLVNHGKYFKFKPKVGSREVEQYLLFS
jgi:hypothetical protein